MRVRRVFDENDGANRKRTIVWFGSYGVNADGTAKFVSKTNKHDNFASNNDEVKDSLIQRLSVIQHELWFNYQYGMPLVDSDTSKIMIDTFVMRTIQDHEDVIEITSFTSIVSKTAYACDVQIKTRFGNVNLVL